MKNKRVLASWIGHADLRAMIPSLDDNQQERLFAELKVDRQSATVAEGPIKTLLTNESFDEIHLLSNYSDWVNKCYVRKLGQKVKIYNVTIDNPTDYRTVFVETNRCLSEIVAGRSIELSLFLSPGTPTMTAIFVLLGKTRFPATFWQTHRELAWKTEIPFDLTVDFLPEILRTADSTFYHLISQSPQEIEGFERIIGNCEQIRMAVGRAKRAAIRDVSVLLLGESGTGKELFAHAIHQASRRKGKPFEAINCAAIPENLIESELFGYRKNAFTGATKDYDGAFKRIDGGTLFLDEVGECPPSLQVKLLRVLQPPHDKEQCHRDFWPIGSKRMESSNVRVIAATNSDLLRDVSEGRFREDLYYRLAPIVVKLPPLRERKADIVAIAETVLERINTDFGKEDMGYKHKKLSAATKNFVKEQPWPGNVRQLRNVLLQAAVMSEKQSLEPNDLIAAVADSPNNEPFTYSSPVIEDGFSLEEHINRIKIKYIQKAMSEANGVKSKAAALLGYENYQTLDAQLKRYGIQK